MIVEDTNLILLHKWLNILVTLMLILQQEYLILMDLILVSKLCMIKINKKLHHNRLKESMCTELKALFGGSMDE